jgi:hypothetical protein
MHPKCQCQCQVASSWTKLEPLSVPLFAQEGAAYDIAHTNMVELHRCTDYCLKPSRPARYRARSEQQVVDGSSHGERILSCRFDFGDEALGVPTRTHGKPVCMIPRLVSRPGRMSMYAPPQGHPRRHRGLRMVGKFWKGNTDTSVLLAPTPRTTLDGIHTGESFLDSLEAYCSTLDVSPSAHAKLREMRAQRPYFSCTGYTDILIDYVTGYINKAEVSADGAVDLMRKVVDEAQDGTSFKALAMRMQMRLTKAREISPSESLWSVAALPFYQSTSTYVQVKRPGERCIMPQ